MEIKCAAVSLNTFVYESMMVNLKMEAGRIKILYLLINGMIYYAHLRFISCRSAGDTSDFEEVQTSRMPVIPSFSHEAKYVIVHFDTKHSILNIK